MDLSLDGRSLYVADRRTTGLVGGTVRKVDLETGVVSDINYDLTDREGRIEDMKIGAIFPTTEIGSDPVAIRDWAQAAEALGYDVLSVPDLAQHPVDSTGC